MYQGKPRGEKLTSLALCMWCWQLFYLPSPARLSSSLKELLKSQWGPSCGCQWDLVGPFPAGWAGPQGFPWPKVVPGADLAGRDLDCVCACVLVSAVQCDSGVGMLVLGGSSFLFELGWQLLAGTRTVRVTRCLPLCN